MLCVSNRNGVKRKHGGLDIVCNDGSTIKAPFDVKLNGRSAPYGNNNAVDNGITLNGQGLYSSYYYLSMERRYVICVYL